MYLRTYRGGPRVALEVLRRVRPAAGTAFFRAETGSGKFSRWLLTGILFSVLFIAAPAVVALTTAFQPSFAVALCFILLALVVFVPGKHAIWRYTLLVALVTTMSGQVGKYFGHSLLSTFVIEDILSLALALLLALYAVGHKRPQVRLQMPLLAVALFGLTMAASTIALLIRTEPLAVYSIWFHLTQATYRKSLIHGLTGFTLAIGAFSLLTDWNRVRSFMRIMLAGALFFSLLAVAEYLLRDNYYLWYYRIFGINEETYVRVSRALYFRRAFGLFTSGPGLAAWLVLFTPLALYGVLFSQNRTRFITSLCILAALIAGIFVTGSRAPLGAMVVAFALLPWLTGRIKIALSATIVLVLLVLAIIVKGPQLAALLPENNLLERIFNPREGRVAATLEKRKEVWADALQKFREHPFLGIGPDQFHTIKTTREIPDPTKLDSAHSGYLQTLAELGYAGALTGLLLMFSTLYYGLTAIRRCPSGPRRGLAAALYCSCLAVFITGITEPAFTLNRNYYVFCLMLGAMLKIPYLPEEDDKSSHAPLGLHPRVPKRSAWPSRRFG